MENNSTDNKQVNDNITVNDIDTIINVIYAVKTELQDPKYNDDAGFGSVDLVDAYQNLYSKINDTVIGNKKEAFTKFTNLLKEKSSISNPTHFF